MSSAARREVPLAVTNTLVLFLSVSIELASKLSPSSSSLLLNVIERWFGKITQDRIRNGVFRSVDAIMSYVEAHNADPTTFVWTKFAEQILQKTRRARAALDNATTA